MGKDAANSSGRGQPTKEMEKACRWLGHALRKPPSCIGRQALNWNPQGQRKRGRPRNTWWRELEKDIKRSGYTWKQLERIAQDRGDWTVVIGGLCSGRSKGPKQVSTCGYCVQYGELFV